MNEFLTPAPAGTITRTSGTSYLMDLTDGTSMAATAHHGATDIARMPGAGVI